MKLLHKIIADGLGLYEMATETIRDQEKSRSSTKTKRQRSNDPQSENPPKRQVG